ncbi:MAG TPA: hypothetical protein VGR35_22795 [Tepidisphaeraceae bacterium]|nr:hypothetical protein [Tepidisphaeraceae bacterium]
MTIQEIKRLRDAKPFEPFRVLVADGNHFDVWHPEYLGRSPSGRIITIGLDDDSFVTLDLLLVAGVHKGIKRKSKNGRTKK